MEAEIRPKVITIVRSHVCLIVLFQIENERNETSSFGSQAIYTTKLI
jgi:hypothetical protein